MFLQARLENNLTPLPLKSHLGLCTWSTVVQRVRMVPHTSSTISLVLHRPPCWASAFHAVHEQLCSWQPQLNCQFCTDASQLSRKISYQHCLFICQRGPSAYQSIISALIVIDCLQRAESNSQWQHCKTANIGQGGPHLYLMTGSFSSQKWLPLLLS